MSRKAEGLQRHKICTFITHTDTNYKTEAVAQSSRTTLKFGFNQLNRLKEVWFQP